MLIELKTESDLKSVYATWRCPRCGSTVEYRYWDFMYQGGPVCLCADVPMELSVPSTQDIPGMSTVYRLPRQVALAEEWENESCVK